MPDPIDELNSQENNTPLDSPAQQSNFNTEPISPTEPVSTVPSPPSEIASNPVNTPFVPDEGPKKSYKKLIIGAIAGFVALIGLGSGAVYAMYMNSPDKVLLDATQNLMKANSVITKGTFVADSKESKMSIKVEFASQSDNAKQAGSLDAKVEVNYMDTKLNFNGEGMVAESGDLYFKLNDTSKMLDTALKSELGKSYVSQPGVAQLAEKVNVFLKKIDGQWIRVNKTDIDKFSSNYSKQQACVKKAFATFNKSDEQQKQVIDTYSENPFLTIESVGKSATINNQDSAAYDISYDAQTSNIFGNELEKTDLMKGINKCTKTDSKPTKLTSNRLKEQQKQANSIKTTLWISKQSHELQKVDIENKDKKPGDAKFSITLDTKTKPSLKDPKKFIKLEDLMPDIMAIYVASGGSNPSFTSDQSSYDTGTTEVGKVLTAVSSYQSNNRGQLPSSIDAAKFSNYLGSTSTSQPIILSSGYNVYLRDAAPSTPTAATLKKTIEIWPSSVCDEASEKAVSGENNREAAVTVLMSDGTSYCMGN